VFPHFHWLTQLGLTPFIKKKEKEKEERKKERKVCASISFSFSLFHSFPQFFFPPFSPTTTVQLRPPRSSADAHPTPTIR
jgi:hypothetical protein